MNLFDGYLISNGKKPLSSVKNKDNWLTEPPTDSDYVGILKENIVQVDFDTDESSKIAMNIVNKYKLKCDILKTSRGVHLYFQDDMYIKSQSVGLYNAIGIKSDIGLGRKNRVVPLRTTSEQETVTIINGKEEVSKKTVTKTREWLQKYDTIDVLPCYFRPISSKDFRLATCDTRNQSLFTYILALQSYDFNKEEIRKTIKVINEFILYEPLPDNEIDQITRDEAFSEELFFTSEGKFMHDRFGNYMLTNSNIILIDNLPHIYTSNGLYSNDAMEFERFMIKKIPHLKDTQRKEVYKYINLQCKKVGTFSNPKFIGFNSEIYDIHSDETHNYNPNFIMNNKINYDYDKNAYDEIMDKTLDKVCCNDKQVRALLEEMIGYSLYRKNTMQVCFILTGGGSNGKSTILNCIKKLIGKGNYTSLDLAELEDTFKPSELYCKLANIGDDISSKYLETSSVFKKCVTGESFMVQKKYGQPFELESYATQIFCANELPPVKDKSDGFNRRLVIVPFKAKFSNTDVDYDPFIEDKLLSDSAITYLLKLAIDGLKRVLLTKKFTISDIGEKEKTEYVKSNNNLLEWFDDEPSIENNSVNDVYVNYSVWCVQNGYIPLKKANFSKEIRQLLKLKSEPKYIDGKTVRVFVKD